MNVHKDDKVHVHCRANYRVSAFIMLYRVLRLGWKKEDLLLTPSSVEKNHEHQRWLAVGAEGGLR